MPNSNKYFKLFWLHRLCENVYQQEKMYARHKANIICGRPCQWRRGRAKT